MPAFVEHSFNRGFLLDEERLRKIRETIQKRSGPDTVTYKVFRGDSYSYTTKNIDDVAKEDNEDWRRIRRLELLIEDGEQLKFALSFAKNGCELRITGADRDEVFLLFSDLRDYIQNEVATVRSHSGKLGPVLIAYVVLFLLMFSVAFYPLFRGMHTDPAALRQVLDSNDVHAKLNFLLDDIGKRESPSPARILVVMAFSILVPVFFTTGAFKRVADYLFPANQFLFGKRRQTHEKRQRTVSNVFWLILVALSVTFVGGLLVWAVTSKR